MQNKKDKVVMIAIIIVIAAITAGLIGWMFGKKSSNFQPVVEKKQAWQVPDDGGQKQQTEKNKHDGWVDYYNVNPSYKIKIPGDYEGVVQNKTDGYGNTMIVKKSDISIARKDKIFSHNPYLAFLSANINGMMLTASSKAIDWPKNDIIENLQRIILISGAYPSENGTSVDVDSTINEFTEYKISDDFSIYAYRIVINCISENCSGFNPVSNVGVVWENDDFTYKINTLVDGDSSLENVMIGVAETFEQYP